MKVAYVSGPYRAKTEWEVRQNIEHAAEIAADLWKMGYAVICPHTNSAFMGGVVPDETFLQGDLAILERCDVLVLMPNWEKSEGAKVEKEFAEACGIPVREWIDLVLESMPHRIPEDTLRDILAEEQEEVDKGGVNFEGVT